MARTKRTPVQREPSSEYTSKLDRVFTKQEIPNGVEEINGKANGVVETSSGASAPVGKKDAGIVTLVIDVAGIYVSL